MASVECQTFCESSKPIQSQLLGSKQRSSGMSIPIPGASGGHPSQYRSVSKRPISCVLSSGSPTRPSATRSSSCAWPIVLMDLKHGHAKGPWRRASVGRNALGLSYIISSHRDGSLRAARRIHSTPLLSSISMIWVRTRSGSRCIGLYILLCHAAAARGSIPGDVGVCDPGQL